MTDSLRNSVLPFEMEIKKLRNNNTDLQLKFDEALKKKQNELDNKESLLMKLNEILRQKDERIDQMENNLSNDRNLKEIYELQDKLEKAEDRVSQLERESTLNSIRPLNIIPNLSKLNRNRQSLRSIEQYNLIKQLSGGVEKKVHKKKENQNLPKSFAYFESILKKKQDELKQKQEDIFDDDLTLNVFDSEKDGDDKKEDIKKEGKKNDTYEFFNKTIESLQEIICKGEEMSKDNEIKLQGIAEENNLLIENVSELKNTIIEKEEMYKELLMNVDDHKIEMESMQKTIDNLAKEKKIIQKSLMEIQSKKRESNANLSDMQSMVLQLKCENTVLTENLDQANYNLKDDKKIYQEEINNLNINLDKKNKEIENLESEIKKQNQKNADLINIISENNQKNLEKEEKILDEMQKREELHENTFIGLNKKIKELQAMKDLEGGLDIVVDEEEKENLQLDNLSFDENHLIINDEIQPDITSESGSEDEFDARESLAIPVSRRKQSIEIRPSIFGVDQFVNNNLQSKLDFNKKEQELEQAKQNILRYIDIDAESKLEIRKLRNELKENKENYIDKEIHNSEINLLKMDIKHLKESQETNKKIHDKKVKNMYKEYEEMTNLYMEAKINYSSACAKIDSYKITYNREVKKLKFQIKLYEDQIKNFNDKYNSK